MWFWRSFCAKNIEIFNNWNFTIFVYLHNPKEIEFHVICSNCSLCLANTICIKQIPNAKRMKGNSFKGNICSLFVVIGKSNSGKYNMHRQIRDVSRRDRCSDISLVGPIGVCEPWNKTISSQDEVKGKVHTGGTVFYCSQRTRKFTETVILVLFTRSFRICNFEKMIFPLLFMASFVRWMHVY